MVGVDKFSFILTIVLMSLFAFSTANAEDLSITVKTIEGTASPGDTLIYEVSFYNLENAPAELSTNLFIGTPEFLPSNRFVVPSKGSHVLTLNVGITQRDADVFPQTGRICRS